MTPLVCSYRTTPHSVTGKSPFEVMRGRKPRALLSKGVERKKTVIDEVHGDYKIGDWIRVVKGGWSAKGESKFSEPMEDKSIEEGMQGMEFFFNDHIKSSLVVRVERLEVGRDIFIQGGLDSDIRELEGSIGSWITSGEEDPQDASLDYYGSAEDAMAVPEKEEDTHETGEKCYSPRQPKAFLVPGGETWTALEQYEENHGVGRQATSSLHTPGVWLTQVLERLRGWKKSRWKI
ncbi:hypothetical protein NDU88_000259 [Pleurodeles waltl]|uniref:Uncharacterized protein n=1 Tax=Pleurodeles waltl TaxID=8319 RepID=A0AAV7UPH5_PLEWA|nr:hypothetical protein NDU88_000259 [Pleurodeles waltl]